jgi:crossover junction endodeoxyribonuclease RuvC
VSTGEPLRVLGIDPGLTRCGYGVIESTTGRHCRLVDVGVVTTPSTETLDQRLLAIKRGLEAEVERHAPDVVAVERMFARSDVSTIMGTAQAAGVAIVLAAERRIPVALYTPSEVKAAITGSGRAGKAQVQNMLVKILGLTGPPRPADAADALAIAICHLWKGPGPVRLDAAGSARTSAQQAWAEAEARARRAVRGTTSAW